LIEGEDVDTDTDSDDDEEYTDDEFKQQGGARVRVEEIDDEPVAQSVR
jgi:hypothetical protein